MRSYFIFVSVIILGCTYSCLRTVEQQNSRIVIAGKIVGYNSSTDDKLVEIIFNDIFDSQVTEICQINEQGEFKHVTTRPYAQDFMFRYGTLMKFYVSPGDSLNIEIDNKIVQRKSLTINEYDLVKFIGPESKTNNDFIKCKKFYSDSLFNFYYEDSIIRVSSPIEYKQHISKRTDEYLKKTEKFCEENDINQTVRVWAHMDIQYEGYNDLMRYRWLYPMYHNIKRDSFKLTIPKEYFSFLDEQTLSNESAVITTNYYSLLEEYLMYLMMDTFPIDSGKVAMEIAGNGDITGSYKMRINHIARNTSQFTCDLLLSSIYFKLLKEGSLTVFEELNFSNPIKEKILNDIIQERYFKTKTVVNNPNLSEKINMNSISKEIIQPIFDTILQKHKGKVLYIDFWAPWCGPCMSEMQYSKKIKLLLEGKNVEFIYLANRCSDEYWNVTIAEEQIEGDHYLLTDDQYKVLTNQFDFSGIPHYILVDSDGNIVDSDAPRPREEDELIEAINKLLID